MELVCVYHEGWLKETRKEEVICTGEILVTDIIPIKSDSVFSVVLNFKYTENKKKTTKAVSLNENEIVQPKVKVKIRNLSNIKSLFAPSYGNYVEGVQMDTETYVKQNFKLSIRRVRRIIRYIKLFLLDIQAIFHYKYPFFSLCCLLVRNNANNDKLDSCSHTLEWLQKQKISWQILSSLLSCYLRINIQQSRLK